MRKLLLLATIFAVSPAFAAPWKVDTTKSKLTFEAEQAGDKLKGEFPKFTAVIEFDEKALDKSSIKVTIDMASATIDGKDRQESLPTSDWFDIAKFPTATFTSTSIRAPQTYNKLGSNQYIAKGPLTIKGVSKEIELPFTLTSLSSQQGAWIGHGEVTLNRQDFSVGTGQWKSDEWVKFPVRVTFLIHAMK